jgi:hypothetical protein
MMFLFRSQMLYRVEQWDDKDRHGEELIAGSLE